jgi:hypothetical protein
MSAVHGNAAWQALSDAPGRILPGFKKEDREADGKSVLEDLGWRPEDARAVVQRVKPLSAMEVRRAAAKSAKGRCGRRGLARDLVAQMYRDYQRVGSLSKVGRLYKRTRQSMHCIFNTAGLPLNGRNFHARILFQGRAYTPGKNGYYRSTDREHPEMLHHVIWRSRTGREIPPGWQVAFLDGDNTNFREANLACLPIREVTLLHYRRRYPGRAGLTPGQRREWWKKYYRERMRERSAIFRARGLRCDGRRLKRNHVHRLRRGAARFKRGFLAKEAA